MKMISATILRLHGTADRVSIKTDLPEPTHPYTGNLELEFRVAKGQAEDYMKKNFPDVPIKEII